MKKESIALLLVLLLSVSCYCQDKFTVDGKKYSVGELARRYKYQYSFLEDSVLLRLADSSQTYQSQDKRVEQTQTYDLLQKVSYTKVNYRKKDGRDSVYRELKNNKPVKLILSKYDSENRLSTYSVKNYEKPDESYDWSYLYRDSVYPKGKMSSVIVFSTYAKRIKSFNYSLNTYMNANGDTLKQVKRNSLGQVDVSNRNIKSFKRVNTHVVKYEQTGVFTKADIQNPKLVVRKYVGALKRKLTDSHFDLLEYNYHNEDQSISVFIKKRNAEQSAVFTVKEKK